MSFKALLSVLSGIVFVYAFYPYIRAILRGETKPKKVTWLVWATGDIIVLVGMILENAVSGQIIGAVLGVSVTLLLSLRYGESGWTGRDKICLSLSGLAIALWIYFGESSIGIALSLVALVIAAWPTYVSAWENPANEDKTAWVWFNISSLLAIFAIPSTNFADIATPITFMAIDAVMVYLLFIRPNWMSFKRMTLGW